MQVNFQEKTSLYFSKKTGMDLKKDDGNSKTIQDNSAVEVTISKEAKELDDKNSEKKYSITVSQEKIPKNSDETQVGQGGSGNAALDTLIAKLAEILAKITELTQKMANANDQMKAIYQKQIEVLTSQANTIEAQIQELEAQDQQ
ncbi:flagellum-secreted nonflagellar protein FspA [Campylobacter taeniopygiae]|uniref:flagellum-secreted nonflagellar protein FspA n=1 Tax=Campylobacter taeniopygiae TaxID=2510188 RepID=UPI001FE78964|nr:flagellum-secreted nonflagellar protein FspA [Campylobacter taeniopygiae]